MDPPTEEGFDDDNELTFVKEAPEVNGLVEQIKDALEGRDPADGTSTISKTVFHKIQEIVERYQEYPTLLDPHLEGWILPLTSVIRREAHKGSEADMVLVQRGKPEILSSYDLIEEALAESGAAPSSAASTAAL